VAGSDIVRLVTGRNSLAFSLSRSSTGFVDMRQDESTMHTMMGSLSRRLRLFVGLKCGINCFLHHPPHRFAAIPHRGLLWNPADRSDVRRRAQSTVSHVYDDRQPHAGDVCRRTSYIRPDPGWWSRSSFWHHRRWRRLKRINWKLGVNGKNSLSSSPSATIWERFSTIWSEALWDTGRDHIRTAAHNCVGTA